MALRPLRYDSPHAAYAAQAEEARAGWERGEAETTEWFRHHLPRFLDPAVPWKPREATEAELRAEPVTAAEARTALARWYGFVSWRELVRWLAAVHDPASAEARFEAAVEAVIDGEADRLREMLRETPGLVHARSGRVTAQDPPVHRATLLHYLAANGVEGLRQRSPRNAAEMARILLAAGADPNALAGMYGGECAPLSMLVSSSPPAAAGVQVELMETLIAYGADVEARGWGEWQAPLETALVFGFVDAAATLARHGARVRTLAAAAGLGDVARVDRMLAGASAEDLHRALVMAVLCGRREAARRLLEAGEDPNRFNPPGMHAHSTPLHQAALAGDLAMVELLLAHGARQDIEDRLWRGTALGWALHGGQAEAAAYLRGAL